MTLAVLDWGIGGAPTWEAIRSLAPSLDLVYVSDSGFAPYGTVPKRELAERLDLLGRSLVSRGVTHVAVACNAASVALDDLHRFHDPACEFFGIIDDGVELALASGAKTIAVLGGNGTIEAGVHERRLKAAGRDVIAVAAQPLSAHVEAGRLQGPATADVERFVLECAGADALLLACTHYSALSAVFRQFTDRPLLDPCQAFAKRVLLAYGPSAGRGTRRALCTGNLHGARAGAKGAFGVDLGLFERFGGVV